MLRQQFFGKMLKTQLHNYDRFEQTEPYGMKQTTYSQCAMIQER